MSGDFDLADVSYRYSAPGQAFTPFDRPSDRNTLCQDLLTDPHFFSLTPHFFPPIFFPAREGQSFSQKVFGFISEKSQKEGMKEYQIEVRTGDLAGRGEIFHSLKEELKADGFELKSADETERTGMTGLEIVIAIGVAFAAEVGARIVVPRIEALLVRVKAKTGKSFTSEVHPADP